MKTSTTKTKATTSAVTTGMTFIDTAARRSGYGRRFVLVLRSTKKYATCATWYELDGAVKKTEIAVDRLLGRDFEYQTTL